MRKLKLLEVSDADLDKIGEAFKWAFSFENDLIDNMFYYVVNGCTLVDGVSFIAYVSKQKSKEVKKMMSILESLEIYSEFHELYEVTNNCVKLHDALQIIDWGKKLS